MRAALGVAAAGLALGCSHGGSLGATGSLLVRESRLSSVAPVGPRTLEARPFDYEALPTLEPVPLTGDLDGAAFSFVPGKEGAELKMDGGVVAEIEIGVHQGFVGDIDIGNPARNRAPAPPRYYHLFRQVDDTGPFAWSAAPGANQLCGHAARPGRARWQGYVHRSRTAEGMAYVCYEGSFDPRACGARAEKAWRVTARPVVADALFGFRVKDGECSPPTPLHEEKLAIIGPRPLWLSSTAPLALRQVDGSRSFSRIVVPVSRAQVASALVDARPADVQLFRGDGTYRGDPSLFSFSVEVTWAHADPAPSAFGFVSVLSGNTSGMHATALSQIPR